MGARADLESAYVAARYSVDVRGHRIDAAVGRHDPALDAALRRVGCRSHWCLLTPCNPGSRRLPDAVNADRLQRLRRLARRCAWRLLPACNSAGGGDWAEPGLCLLDAPPAQVHELARRWGQLAWLYGQLGAAPLLMWTNRELSRAGRRGRGRDPARCGRGCVA